VKKKIVEEIIIASTGEVIPIFEGGRFNIINPDQQKIINKSKKEKNRNKEIIKWNKQFGGFIFILFKYCSTINEKHPEMTQEDITKLFYLATFVDFDGNLIYENSFMTRKDMCNLLCIHITNFDKFFNKMKKFGIFMIDSNKNIQINKEYFTKGKIEEDLYKIYNYSRLYIDSIQYLFENVPQRSHKYLGNYFKMIPYIHRQWNFLCWDPEASEQNIKLMYIKDLKDILNYSKNSINKLIDELVAIKLKNGDSIVSFWRKDRDIGKSYIIINPMVFYGGNFNIKGGKNSIIEWFTPIMFK